MKFTIWHYLLPLGLALYSVLCTAFMLVWASRRGRTPKSYKWGLVLYVILFALPTVVLVVPMTMTLPPKDPRAVWAFFATACILGQLFPMFATHGYWAMWRHKSWGRIISLRYAAFHEGDPRHVRPPSQTQPLTPPAV